MCMRHWKMTQIFILWAWTWSYEINTHRQADIYNTPTRKLEQIMKVSHTYACMHTHTLSLSLSLSLSHRYKEYEAYNYFTNICRNMYAFNLSLSLFNAKKWLHACVLNVFTYWNCAMLLKYAVKIISHNCDSCCTPFWQVYKHSSLFAHTCMSANIQYGLWSYYACYFFFYSFILFWYHK